MHNILRKIRVQTRAMQAEFAAAKTACLEATKLEIASQYPDTDTDEKREFCFDSFSFWSEWAPCMPKSMSQFLVSHDLDLYLDEWGRGKFCLSLREALELALLVDQWNATWEYQVAQKYEGIDPSRFYNAWRVAFFPATGREERIVLNAGTYKATDAWQF